MKRNEAFPNKTFDAPIPLDTPANNEIQHYYDSMIESVGHHATPEQVVAFMARIDGFVQAAKRLQSDMKLAIIDWIEEHGDIEVDNDTRYYVGKDTVTKCRDLTRVGLALTERCNGDLDEVFGFIKSEGWKHGSVKTKLGQDTFEDLYTTEKQLELKTGKPIKLLKKSNPIHTPNRKETDEKIRSVPV